MDYSSDMIDIAAGYVSWGQDSRWVFWNKNTIDAISNIWGDGWKAEAVNIVGEGTYYVLTRDDLYFGFTYKGGSKYFYESKILYVNKGTGEYEEFGKNGYTYEDITILKVCNPSYFAKVLRIPDFCVDFTISEFLKNKNDIRCVLEMECGIYHYSTIEYDMHEGRLWNLVRPSCNIQNSPRQILVMTNELLVSGNNYYESDGHIMYGLYDYSTEDKDKVIEIDDNEYLHIMSNFSPRKYILVGEEKREDE